MEAAVIDLLKRSAAIPSMPQVAARFLEIIQDPDFDYRDVVEVLSSDPGTASEILRLANSSLFGVTRNVSSLPQALTLLGMRRVRSLVLGRYIVDSIDRKTDVAIDLTYFWRRSLTCAVLAGHFAAVAEPQSREEAFICGLLADIGVVVLAEAIPGEYASLAAQYRPDGELGLAVKERALIGISHAQASALVLAHWRLPDLVCEAVNWHPWELDEIEAPPLARVVAAADVLAKYFCDTQPDLGRVLDVCRQIETLLGLSDERLGEILLQIEHQIADLAQTLRVQTTGLDTCRALAAALHQQILQTQAVPAS